jgi:50S ribosomal protein L16 3-hydroxylase
VRRARTAGLGDGREVGHDAAMARAQKASRDAHGAGDARSGAPRPAPLAGLLGGLPPDEFLRRYWQKEPLLVRQAIPGFAGLVSFDEMVALAARDDVLARLVFEHPRRKRGRYELHEGPLHGLAPALRSGRLPKKGWTFLVPGLEAHVPGAWELLRRFSFLPAARIDDIMVSWAAPGGSVGPHDDLYDVFLLQGPGRRRWQIARRYEREFSEHEPMKVLRSFEPEEEWVLEPGDMLYLPPRVAHHGVALEPCFTYSVGFLAPSHDALLQNFLAFLAQRLAADTPPEAVYQDPELQPVDDPLILGDDMLAKVGAVLSRVSFEPRDVEEFTGRLLTGPKPHVRFSPPARPMSAELFLKKLRGRAGALRLALPTRALVRGASIFVNGERRIIARADLASVRALLAERALPLPVRLEAQTALVLWELYAAGWLELEGARAA